MLKSIYALLARAIALLTALTDEEVRSYLAASGFPLDQLSQGNSIVERAKSAVSTCVESRVRMRGLTEAMERFFAIVYREVSVFRFVALRAFRSRTDLVEGLGLGPRAPRDRPQAPTDGQPAPAEVEEVTRLAKERIPARFLTSARTLLTAVLGDEGALVLLAPYGIGKERITALLGRVAELETLDRDQDAAQRVFHAASAASEQEAREFRRWHTPWRRLVRTALAGRPDLMQRVGVA